VEATLMEGEDSLGQEDPEPFVMENYVETENNGDQPIPRSQARGRVWGRQDWARPREDTEEMWHLRAGHLAAKGVRELVRHARNVQIRGIRRSECEACRRAFATQNNSSTKEDNDRERPRRSPRPFWRISWDLFDFPTGLERAEWLLLIKDDFSGKPFVFVIPRKTAATVIPILISFIKWVKRQFGLTVCKVRQDGDTGSLGINPNGETQWTLYAKEEGIELEVSPPDTHEPNGGAERAGQEIINRSIAMRETSGLPDHLWPETVKAAAHLIGMSPTARNQWKSPNEKLYAWYKQYFRWYEPPTEHAHRFSTDLRPDWNGIYAYGCRAYPLVRAREKGEQKRHFKVSPRAHVGYLVGYRASNIYRIWIPSLNRVVSTRNVTFDERYLYSEGDEQEAMAVPLARDTAKLIQLEEEAPSQARNVMELLDQLIELDATPIVRAHEQPLAPGNLFLQGEQTPRGQDSGVSEPGETGTGDPVDKDSAEPGPRGLLTPDSTPTPRGTTPVDGLDGASGHSSSRHGSAGGRGTVLPSVEEEPQTSTSREGATHLDEELEAEDTGPLTLPRIRLGTPIPSSSPPGPSEAQVSSETVPPNEGADTPGTDVPSVVPDTTEPPVAPERSKKPETTKKAPTRASARLRKQRGDPGDLGGDDDPGATTQGVYFMTNWMYEYDKETIDAPGEQESAWSDFFQTFMPERDRALECGATMHRTLHAVFAAAVKSDPQAGQGADPRLPRVHRDQIMELKLPRRWRDLKAHTFGLQFSAACDQEIRTLINRKTWRKVTRASVKGKPLPLKWVFTVKYDDQGFLTQFKARICVRGDLQPADTLQNTYAATLAARSFRTMMAIAAEKNWDIRSFDVIQAFLYALRDPDGRPVVCELPEGYEEDGMVVELERALYGLRDSPVLWYREFSAALRALGMECSGEEPCLFYNKERTVYVLFYVDDYLVMNPPSARSKADKIVDSLKAKYEVKDQGDISVFLGIRVLRDRQHSKMWLVHDQYLEKIAKKYTLDDISWLPAIPLPNLELQKHMGTATKAQIKEFQELVGSILYAAIMTRPDAAYAAAHLSHFLTNPSVVHIGAAKQVIRYLFGTRFLAIQYGGGHHKPEDSLVIAGDASYANDPDTRKSTFGYIMFLFGGAINWKSAKQDTITTSSTEAELLALTTTGKETMALGRLLRDVSLDLGSPLSVYCDNQQTIRLVVSDSERISTKLRHVDVHQLWARQEHAKGSFEVKYLPTGDMPADGLTKALTRQKFEHFRKLLNMKDTGHMVTSKQRN
jgi:hypothetical protein